MVQNLGAKILESKLRCQSQDSKLLLMADCRNRAGGSFLFWKANKKYFCLQLPLYYYLTVLYSSCYWNLFFFKKSNEMRCFVVRFKLVTATCNWVLFVQHRNARRQKTFKESENWYLSTYYKNHAKNLTYTESSKYLLLLVCKMNKRQNETFRNGT